MEKTSIKGKCVLDGDKCQGTSSLVPPNVPLNRASAPEKQAMMYKKGGDERMWSLHIPACWLVCRRFLRPINDQNRQGNRLRIQFQPKLLLDRLQ